MWVCTWNTVIETQNGYKALYDVGQVTSKVEQCHPFCLFGLQASWDRLASYVHAVYSEVLELFILFWSCSVTNNSGSWIGQKACERLLLWCLGWELGLCKILSWSLWKSLQLMIFLCVSKSRICPHCWIVFRDLHRLYHILWHLQKTWLFAPLSI